MGALSSYVGLGRLGPSYACQAGRAILASLSLSHRLRRDSVDSSDRTGSVFASASDHGPAAGDSEAQLASELSTVLVGRLTVTVQA